MRNMKPIIKICVQCGTEYEVTPTGTSRFCSNKCKSAWRRASGLDDEDRKCPICKKIFRVNKYSNTKTCSRSCGDYLRGRTINEDNYKLKDKEDNL
jgi:endogenous inhibitor of DNA gyrase (YacG/DUF329 family)